MNYLALAVLIAFAVGIQADLRDTLVERAHSIENTLRETISVLKESNDTKDVEILEKEETKLKELTAELLAVPSGHKHHHELVELEKKLRKLEANMSHQIQVISRTPEVIRITILKNYENFTAYVEKEAKHLEEQDFPSFADELRADLAKLSDVVDQLRDTTEHEAIAKLDKEIFEIGTHITNKLAVVRRDLHNFQTLLNTTESLLRDFQQFYGELVQRNFTDAGELLRVDVAELELVRDELKQETSIFVFDYLQEKLWDLEKQLYRKLTEIKHLIHPDDEVASDLLKKAEDSLEAELDRLGSSH